MYSREDYLMYLLSGGDTPIYHVLMVKGPQSKCPMTLSGAIEFVNHVNLMSGLNFFIPGNGILRIIMESDTDTYDSWGSWGYFDDYTISKKKPGGKISSHYPTSKDTVAHVVLVRYI